MSSDTSTCNPTNAVRTTAAPPPRGHYAQARVTGDLVFTAGLGPVHPQSGAIVGVDAAAQTRQVLENLAAVLAAAGSTMDEVVQLNAFLADPERDWDAYDSVFPEYFDEPFPARITAGADLGGILVEIAAIAHRTLSAD